MDYSWGLLGEWLGIKRTVADNELKKCEKSGGSRLFLW